MDFKCYQCNTVEVSEEFQRCPPCQLSHAELAKKLDAQPKHYEKPVKEKLYPIREVKQGVQVTTWIDRNDAVAMGIKVE